MTQAVPRIEILPDQDGAPGFLLTAPLLVGFELELKGVVPSQDLYWSPKPAGWWIPERYLARVQALTRDYFGYVQVLHADGRREHDFHQPEVPHDCPA